MNIVSGQKDILLIGMARLMIDHRSSTSHSAVTGLEVSGVRHLARSPIRAAMHMWPHSPNHSVTCVTQLILNDNYLQWSRLTGL